jgi:hypothetical protein
MLLLAFHSLFPTDHLYLSNRAIDSRLSTLSIAEVRILAEIMSASSLECLARKVAMILFHYLNQISIAGKVVRTRFKRRIKGRERLVSFQ